MSQLLAKMIVITLVLIGLASLGQLAYTRVQLEMQDMRAEHACIGKFISQEIPRNQIGQGDGHCWIKEDYKGL